MSSSHLHTIHITKEVDEKTVKRFEVNAPERITDTFSRQLLIQFKDELSCQSGMVCDDFDFFTSDNTAQQNQKNRRTFYIQLNESRTGRIMRKLIENKDHLLEAYVQHLLEHNIRFNELDLPRNRLLFEVPVKDQTDIDETVEVCLTPFKSWFGEESKPSLNPYPTISGPEIRNNGTSNGQRSLFNNPQVTNTRKETVTSGITQHSNEGTVSPQFSTVDPKRNEKDCEPVTIEDLADLKEKVAVVNREVNEKYRHESRIRIESINPSKDRGRASTDVYERMQRLKAQTSYSEADKSAMTLAVLNSRSGCLVQPMERGDYIIDGGEHKQGIETKETDIAAWTRELIDVLMNQANSSQSEALQRVKEVYLNLMSDVSLFYKYHYFDFRSTAKEFILVLVAGLKDSKFLGHQQLEQIQYEIRGDRRSDARCSFDTDHKRSYHNEKSEKWAGYSIEDFDDLRGLSPVDSPKDLKDLDKSGRLSPRDSLKDLKDLDKSGRLSPEGGNEIEDDMDRFNDKNGIVEPTDAQLKARAMGKMPPEGSQSPFFHTDRPETDGYHEEQGESNPLNSLTSFTVSQNISQALDENRPDYSDDENRPEHSDTGNSNSEEVNERVAESEFNDDLDFPNSYPGVRTAPEGWRTDTSSRGAGSLGASGGGSSTTNRYKAFLDSWKINLGDNGEGCLYDALQGCESVQNSAPNTMFLLDLSKSMQQNDLVTQMKTEVQNILQEAGSKHLRGQMSETYGVAVFGKETKVLLYPTVQLHEVQDVLEGQRFNQPDGRSPLGLGLLLCTCVWFSEKGTGGAIWLHGRKIKPRIIVISDMKMNEVAERAGTVREEMEEDEFAPNSYEIIEVKNELIKIALRLQQLGIPVYVVPVGDTREVRSHLEGTIEMTGGKILDKNGGQLGRQTWQQILACNILEMLSNNVGQLSAENIERMVKTYTGDDPEHKEIIKRIMAERGSRERKEDNIRLLIQQTGEPGEQLWSDLPLGERVRRITDAHMTGTVVGHLHERKVLVQLDNRPPGELESLGMEDLETGPPRDCREDSGETHVVGSRVRRISSEFRHSYEADEAGCSIFTEDRSEVGTVLTLSTLQPSVVYVAWSGDQIRRHSVFDICRFQEKDRNYEFDHYWLFCDKGQWRPFPLTVSKDIEEKKRRKPSLKTLLITLEEKQHRMMFSKKQMRLITQYQEVLYSIHRQAIIPP